MKLRQAEVQEEKAGLEKLRDQLQRMETHEKRLGGYSKPAGAVGKKTENDRVAPFKSGEKPLGRTGRGLTKPAK